MTSPAARLPVSCRLALATAALGLWCGSLSAQDRPWTLPQDSLLRAGVLAWDRGEYPTALDHYLQALATDSGPERVREIAALTGEVFTTTEISSDGGTLEISPDGAYMSFRVEEGGRMVTRVVDVATGATVTTLEAEVSALGPDGRVAYLTTIGPAIAAARRANATATGRQARVDARRALQLAIARDSEVRIRDLTTGADRVEEVAGLKLELVWAVDQLHVVGMTDDGLGMIWDTANDRDVFLGSPGYPRSMRVIGSRVLVDVAGEPVLPIPGAGPEGEPGTILGTWRSGSVVLERAITGTDVTISEDGSVFAYMTRDEEGRPTLGVGMPAIRGVPSEAIEAIRYTPDSRLADPVVSPDGQWVAFAQIDLHDWEIMAMSTETGEIVRVTDHIHHDRRPQWVGDRILAVRGEGRHQRSYLYDVERVAEPTKLFHNNTIRTIAPEYQWAPTPDGSAVFVVAERDGDTVSPERGVYKVDLARPVVRAELERRLHAMAEAENALRDRGAESFRVMAEDIAPVAEAIDATRVAMYAADLYRFGSKNIRAEGGGNRRAIEYLVETLEGWGYEPILDWWQIPPDIETSNVVVRIEGTKNPELVYVVSSHFDSSTRGPGADDNSSGTTALLEVARVLADRPQDATIELAFFTGEESGLLGSRRYVALARQTGKRIVGALNNDMVGWAGDGRLDNTIRYSNPGIRDIQHAAAMTFSKLITYDALYYKSTDAAAYYEAYGDIVGGIGSYPVLSNPHYHRYTDRLETIDHDLVAEVARTTAASIMLLASTPSRLTELEARRVGDEVQVGWSAAPEADIVAYEIGWTDEEGEPRYRKIEASGGGSVTTRVSDVAEGATIEVWAVDADGQRGWDAARVVVAG